ncbi:MAG: phosphate ABC transporter permease PstA [Clostridiales bacterium]|nr:phosphate ABC transporter permease PstA [Clostridiales bacterium]
MENNSICRRRINVGDIAARIAIYLSTGISILVTVGIMAFIIYKGYKSLTWDFVFSSAFSYPYEHYGILSNIINSLYIIFGTLIIALPIGIISSIYLCEYARRGILTSAIEFAVEILTGIPSIIYGLFGYMYFYILFKHSFSILSGIFTLSVMILPTIIRMTGESIKATPKSYREGAIALGAGRLLIIRTIVLPCSLSGIAASITLSIGRIMGESAALIFTAGISSSMPTSLLSHFTQSGGTLSVALFQYMQRGGSEMKYAYAAAAILLIIVLLHNIITMFIRRKEY